MSGYMIKYIQFISRRGEEGEMVTVLVGMLYLFRFIFGVCIFSFLTVVIYRLPKGENIEIGRAHV